MGKRKIFYTISSALILIGLINIFVRGFEFGIDFKGGVEVALDFQKPVTITEIRDHVSDIGLGEVEVKTFGSDRSVLIRSELSEVPKELFSKIESNLESTINASAPGLSRKVIEKTSSSIVYSFDSTSVVDQLTQALSKAGFQATKTLGDSSKVELSVRVAVSDLIQANLKEKIKDNSFKVLREEKVGPKVGSELKRNALIAVALSLLAILVYLGFRFKFSFAISAILAVFHDIFITLGLFSTLYGLIPGLNLEISLTVIGAFLTLMGYSMNDTVVVYDRVREYMKIYKTMPLKDVMNKAINRTFSRTIITGFSTLMCVILLFIFGGEVLRSFAFALFMGIVIGTYSSIFVASVFVLEYANITKKKIEF
jgi:preprotein translocase SecF subunit